MTTTIPNFQNVYSDISTMEAVRMLHDVITDLDAVLSEEQFSCVEKLKSTGSGYTVCLGLNAEEPIDDDEDHLKLSLCLLVEMYFAMKGRLAFYSSNHQTKLLLRGGMDCGHTTAGVVGYKRPVFDMWGTSVNMTFFLERSGHPNSLHVTDSTYSIIRKSPYQFRYNGVGLLPNESCATYFIVGKLAAGQQSLSLRQQFYPVITENIATTSHRTMPNGMLLKSSSHIIEPPTSILPEVEPKLSSKHNLPFEMKQSMAQTKHSSVSASLSEDTTPQQATLSSDFQTTFLSTACESPTPSLSSQLDGSLSSVPYTSVHDSTPPPPVPPPPQLSQVSQLTNTPPPIPPLPGHLPSQDTNIQGSISSDNKFNFFVYELANVNNMLADFDASEIEEEELIQKFRTCSDDQLSWRDFFQNGSSALNSVLKNQWFPQQHCNFRGLSDLNSDSSDSVDIPDVDWNLRLKSSPVARNSSLEKNGKVTSSVEMQFDESPVHRGFMSDLLFTDTDGISDVISYCDTDGGNEADIDENSFTSSRANSELSLPWQLPTSSQISARSEYDNYKPGRLRHKSENDCDHPHHHHHPVDDVCMENITGSEILFPQNREPLNLPEKHIDNKQNLESCTATTNAV